MTQYIKVYTCCFNMNQKEKKYYMLHFECQKQQEKKNPCCTFIVFCTTNLFNIMQNIQFRLVTQLVLEYRRQKSQKCNPYNKTKI